MASQSHHSDEITEDDYEVLSNDQFAEWDGDQTKFLAPTTLETTLTAASYACIDTAKCGWGSIQAAAGKIAHEVSASVAAVIAPNQRLLEARRFRDVEYKRPPSQQYVPHHSKTKITKRELLEDGRAARILAADLEDIVAGSACTRDDVQSDPMVVSHVWHRPVGEGTGANARKKELMGEWKARNGRIWSKRRSVEAEEREKGGKETNLLLSALAGGL
ncbi:hypothetical protein MMC13_005668 [Lambiella insularis]|nr:hypothetical protein [Lambiella insularis]